MICSKRERSRLTLVDDALDERDHPRVVGERRDVAVEMPCAAAHFATSASSSVMRAAGNGRRSPTTIAWETYFDALRSFSRFCGAMFLPPAVTMMSFLRSVILTKPSASISAMSPVWSQPSGVEHLGRRRRDPCSSRRRPCRCGSGARRRRRCGARSPGSAGPTVPNRQRSGVFVVAAVVHSLRP